MLKKPLLLLVPFLLCGCSSNSNVRKYDDVLKEAIDNPDFHSQLYIFPENTDKGTPKNFAYKSLADLLTGSYFLYLVMDYDEENFNKELERLDKIEGHFPEGQSKPILHYEEESIYLTISKDKRFEYAKYNKEKFEIAYVSNQLFSNMTANVQPNHTLPSLTIPSELDDGDNSYNMYYFYSDEPDGMGGTLHVGIYVSD